MRGKHKEFVVLMEADRITPARAGKTEIAESWKKNIEDHPRACGENRQ